VDLLLLLALLHQGLCQAACCWPSSCCPWRCCLHRPLTHPLTVPWLPLLLLQLLPQHPSPCASPPEQGTEQEGHSMQFPFTNHASANQLGAPQCCSQVDMPPSVSFHTIAAETWHQTNPSLSRSPPSPHCAPRVRPARYLSPPEFLLLPLLRAECCQVSLSSLLSSGSSSRGVLECQVAADGTKSSLHSSNTQPHPE
jgi:hypothetical protein